MLKRVALKLLVLVLISSILLFHLVFQIYFPLLPKTSPPVVPKLVFPLFLTRYGHFQPSSCCLAVTMSTELFPVFHFLLTPGLTSNFLIFFSLGAIYAVVLNFHIVEQMSLLKLKCYSHGDQLCISESFRVAENNLTP